MRTRSKDSPKLQALAFDDAVRDILAADGSFHLADEERGDGVWQWDGQRWQRLVIGEPNVVAVVHEEDRAFLG